MLALVVHGCPPHLLHLVEPVETTKLWGIAVDCGLGLTLFIFEGSAHAFWWFGCLFLLVLLDHASICQPCILLAIDVLKTAMEVVGQL